MIRTIIIPYKNTIQIDVPEDYIGKQIEVLLYATDELEVQEPKGKNTFKLRGKLNLSNQEYNDFQKYLKDVRKEWDRDI